MSHAICVKHQRRASVHNDTIMHHDASRCDGREMRWHGPDSPVWSLDEKGATPTPEERLLYAIFAAQSFVGAADMTTLKTGPQISRLQT